MPVPAPSAFDTSRLNCVPLRQAHAEAMFDVLQDANLYHYTDDHPPETLEALQRRYQRLESGISRDGSETWLNWIMFLKTANQPIGFYQATVREDHASIAYVVNSRHWHRGLATEAGAAVLPYLFDNFVIDEIRAEISESNEASIILAKRLGLIFKERDAAARELIFSITRKGRGT